MGSGVAVETQTKARTRIGVDIGGTFTDIVAVDAVSNEYEIIKVSSTPANYMLGIKSGLEQLFSKHSLRPDEVDLFFHGTTVATNTVIEKKGSRTGLLVTAGFRDVLEIGRTSRPPVDLYNLDMDRPAPLVPRRRRLGVTERMDYRGRIVKSLDELTVRQAVQHMLDQDIEALAISFINSYANPVHERKARDIALDMQADLYVAVSSEINPQYKEFERTSTTVMSAYVGPRVSRYVEQVKTLLTQVGVKSPLHIMQASGGAMTVDNVKDRAVQTILSGPAAGVLGAVKVGRSVGQSDFISFDMGGTSTDVSLVQDGQFRIVEQTEQTGYHLRMPMMDIVTIGAGGGSIAWIDTGGALKVGPHSAGAEPGPACYGKGESATVTDAHVVLGSIDPKFFLGGQMSLNAQRSSDAVGHHVARPLGLSLEQAAEGIVRVANANMIRAIKRVSIERGLDVREFALVAFGGAGPLHAAQLAEELGMKKVIVPLHPAVLSACGLVEADLEYQHVQTVLERLDDLDNRTLRRHFADLEERGRNSMHSAGVDPSSIEFRRAANLRYRKQVRQVTVELGYEMADRAWIRRKFRAEHEQLYGYATDEPVEVVDLRVAAVYGLGDPVSWHRAPAVEEPSPRNRRVYFDELNNTVECPVFARDELSIHARVEGPAIVEQEQTSVLVRPGQTLALHASGNLVITTQAGGRRCELE